MWTLRRCRYTQVAHKFNVRSALHYCDKFLSSKADEDPQFFNLGVSPLARTPAVPQAAQHYFKVDTYRSWRAFDGFQHV